MIYASLILRRQKSRRKGWGGVNKSYNHWSLFFLTKDCPCLQLLILEKDGVCVPKEKEKETTDNSNSRQVGGGGRGHSLLESGKEVNQSWTTRGKDGKKKELVQLAQRKIDRKRKDKSGGKRMTQGICQY